MGLTYTSQHFRSSFLEIIVVYSPVLARCLGQDALRAESLLGRLEAQLECNQHLMHFQGIMEVTPSKIVTYHRS